MNENLTAVFLNDRRFENPQPRLEVDTDKKRFAVIINGTQDGKVPSFQLGDSIKVELIGVPGTYRLIGKYKWFIANGEFTGIVEGDIPDHLQPS